MSDDVDEASQGSNQGLNCGLSSEKSGCCWLRCAALGLKSKGVSDRMTGEGNGKRSALALANES